MNEEFYNHSKRARVDNRKFASPLHRMSRCGSGFTYSLGQKYRHLYFFHLSDIWHLL